MHAWYCRIAPIVFGKIHLNTVSYYLYAQSYITFYALVITMLLVAVSFLHFSLFNFGALYFGTYQTFATITELYEKAK